MTSKKNKKKKKSEISRCQQLSPSAGYCPSVKGKLKISHLLEVCNKVASLCSGILIEKCEYLNFLFPFGTEIPKAIT